MTFHDQSCGVPAGAFIQLRDRDQVILSKTSVGSEGWYTPLYFSSSGLLLEKNHSEKWKSIKLNPAETLKKDFMLKDMLALLGGREIDTSMKENTGSPYEFRMKFVWFPEKVPKSPNRLTAKTVIVTPWLSWPVEIKVKKQLIER